MIFISNEGADNTENRLPQRSTPRPLRRAAVRGMLCCVVSLLAVGLTACAIADLAASRVPTPYTLSNEASIVLTDNDGNQVTAKLTIGDWIRGSDKKALERAWLVARGTTLTPVYPMTETLYEQFDDGIPVAFDADNAIIAIGRVRYEATDHQAGKSFNHGPEGTGYAGTVLSVTGYVADIFECIEYTYAAPVCYVNGPLAEPAIVGQTWGSVPIVIALPDFFKNREEGAVDPSLIQLTLQSDIYQLYITDTATLTLGKTW